VRENVLWYLRRGLEGAAEVQRGMVEKRIERVREKEKSVLYKAAAGGGLERVVPGAQDAAEKKPLPDDGYRMQPPPPPPSMRAQDTAQGEMADIESQLSPEQLQLFAEENDSMLKHYEDTLSKVQYVSRLPFPRLPSIYFVCAARKQKAIHVSYCPD